MATRPHHQQCSWTKWAAIVQAPPLCICLRGWDQVGSATHQGGANYQDWVNRYALRLADTICSQPHFAEIWQPGDSRKCMCKGQCTEKQPPFRGFQRFSEVSQTCLVRVLSECFSELSPWHVTLNLLPGKRTEVWTEIWDRSWEVLAATCWVGGISPCQIVRFARVSPLIGINMVFEAMWWNHSKKVWDIYIYIYAYTHIYTYTHHLYSSDTISACCCL